MTKNDVLLKKEPMVNEFVGEDIGYEKGSQMVRDYYDQFGDKRPHFVGRHIIEKVLSQPDCVGINLYKALNDKGEQTYVMVGVNQNGECIFEYPVVNDNGALSKAIGIVANKFLPPDPKPKPKPKTEIGWDWDL